VKLWAAGPGFGLRKSGITPSCPEPTVTLSPSSGSKGDTIMVEGQGWLPGGTVTITATGPEQYNVTSVPVPDSGPGRVASPCPTTRRLVPMRWCSVQTMRGASKLLYRPSPFILALSPTRVLTKLSQAPVLLMCNLTAPGALVISCGTNGTTSGDCCVPKERHRS
jgi:hypothetical protein